jgi:nitric oxide reductase large subunit
MLRMLCASSRRGSSLTFGTMSAHTSLFAAYFGVGLLLMTVAVASRKAKSRLTPHDQPVDGGILTAALLILIALLWPIWLVVILFLKRNDHEANERPNE